MGEVWGGGPAIIVLCFLPCLPFPFYFNCLNSCNLDAFGSNKTRDRGRVFELKDGGRRGYAELTKYLLSDIFTIYRGKKKDKSC